MQKHEVKVENKAGQEMVVSAANYANNMSKYKMLEDNGWTKDKMSALVLQNKGMTNADKQKDANDSSLSDLQKAELKKKDVKK